ncbi:phosphotransferase [Candidatus Pacearchaeota archaeon]|jgi:hypothetical protein|nr:phosphotransferase [Candidatus Pacearchaeota archaeon]
MGPIIFIKELSGFSGCKINLYSKEGKLFVRKISSSLEYNNRLKMQMEKQKFFFDNLKNERISTPEIYDSGYTNTSLFFFDMEYIPSITLIEHVLNSPPDKLKKISEILLEIINLMKSKRSANKIDLRSKAKSKIEEINKKIGKVLENLFDNYNLNSNFFPELFETSCHGDLTFENILYNEKNKKYYLIDFLDSFVEHYWLDIVKMYQDLEGRWYLLRNPEIDQKLMEVKMYFISEYLKQKLINDDYWKFHSFLLKLNFARILPYTNGEKFNQVLKKIREIN